MKKALHKDFRMEVQKSKSRFISIFLIVSLGVAFYSGIQASDPGMRKSSDRLYDEQNLMDIKVMGTMGLTEKDVEALQSLEEISFAEGAWSTDVLCGEDTSVKVLHVESLNTFVNQPIVLEGRLPEKSGECFMDASCARASGYKIGDVICLKQDEEQELLTKEEFTLVGIGNSPMYISAGRGNSTVGSGAVSGFLYVVPEDFDQEVYTQIYLRVESADEELVYTDGYDNLIEKVMDVVESQEELRCKARYDEVVSEAQAELDDAWEEYLTEKADAEKELEDAYQKLLDGEQEILDAKTEIEDGEQQIADAKIEIVEGKQELAEGRKEIADGWLQISDAKKEVESGWSQLLEGQIEINDGLKQLKDAQAEVDAGWEEIQKAQSELDEGMKTLEDAQKEVDNGWTELNSVQAEINAGWSEVEAGQAELNAGKKELEKAQEEINNGWAEIETGQATIDVGWIEMEAGQAKIDDGWEQLNNGQAELDAGKAELEAAQAEIDAGLVQVDAAQAEIDAGVLELDSAQAEIDAGWIELNAGQTEIDAGLALLTEKQLELDAGKAELETAKTTISAGRVELEAAKETLSSQQMEVSQGMEEISNGKTVLQTTISGLNEQKTSCQESLTALSAVETELDGQKAALDAEKITLETMQAEYDAAVSSGTYTEEELLQKASELESYKNTVTEHEQAYTEGAANAAEQRTSLESALSEIEAGLTAAAAEEALLLTKEAELVSAQAEIDAAKLVLDEKEAEILESETVIAEKELLLNAGQTEIDSGKAELEASQQLLNENKAKLEAGQAEIDAGRTELEAGQTELDANCQTLLAAQQEVNVGKIELEAGQAQLEASKAELEAGQAELDAGKAELEAGQAEIDAGKAELEAGQAELNAGKAELEAGQAELDAAKAKLIEGQAELDAGKEKLEAGQAEIDENRQKLVDGQAELDAGKEELEAGQAEIDKNHKKLMDGQKEINKNKRLLAEAREEIVTGENELREANQEILDGEQEILDGEKEIAENEQKLADAKVELADGEKELQDGWTEYEEGKAEAEEEFVNAEEELADAQETINDIEVPEWYVMDRNDLPEHADYGDNATRIKSLGKVFPVMFFLVAALISLTTMTRMVEEQRTLIGTMKALGYKKREIAFKYVAYALLATLGGSILGVLVGEMLIPFVIIKAYGIVYKDIAESICLGYEYKYALVASGAALICTVGATLFSINKALAETPASLMRPPTPKAGKRILIERITFLWNRLNFSWKSSLRNMFRYKKRLFMTIFGIAGSMALMIIGFGIRDSILGIAKLQYTELQHYDGMIIHDEDATEEEMEALVQYLEGNDQITLSSGIQMTVMEFKTEKSHLNIYVYVPEDLDAFNHDITLQDRVTKERYQLPDEGAAISEKTATMLNLEVGDSITIINDNVEYTVPVAVITENYMGHYAYMTEEVYEKAFQEKPDFLDIIFSVEESAKEHIEEIGNEILKYDAALSISYTANIAAQIESMIGALVSVIPVLIISAGLLSFVVLYNLNNINITERQREIATLKVLGFYDGEVSQYVFRENIFLTVLGIIAGSFGGVALHRFVILTVEVDSIMFGRNINIQSFVVCSLFTIFFSILINLIMHNKLKKIDMVESLKSVE